MRLLCALSALVATGSALTALADSGPEAAPIREVRFRPLDPLEWRYLYRDLGSQVIRSEHTRFQDGHTAVVYRFAFLPATRATLQIGLSGEYLVELSSDGRHYETAAASTSRDRADLTLDLTPYAASGQFVYLRVGDAKPEDGWGGKVWEITVRGRLLDLPAPAVANITPTFLERRSRLYPQLGRPERRLFHFAAHGATMEERILFRTLQGLVNRERNELLIGDDGDVGGLRAEAVRLGWADGVTEIPDAEALFARYPKRDAVIYDPACYGSENLAVMIGAMEGLVTAHPDLVARYGLTVREDLRGRWKTALEGYREVYGRYRGRFNRQVLVMCAPSKRPALYDYAVAHRAFTFWIGGTDRQAPHRWTEEEWFERVLSADFPVNIPILGYPQVEPEDGIGENRGVALFSRCGKFLVPTDHVGNLSLLSAYPHARGRITIPKHQAPPLDRGKVYAALVLSDGDNLVLWTGPDSFMFSYLRRMRGDGPRTFGVSYTLGPSIVDLNPLAASLVNDALEPPDSIGCAVSGVGCMYMSGYAENFGGERERVVREYVDLTSRYMAYAGEHWSWIMDYGGPGSERLREYARLVGGSALMGGYGRETTDPAETAEEVGPMVAFHSVSRAVEKEEVLRDVQRVTDAGARPLFLHVFLSNWSVDPAECRTLAEELQARGITIVTPEALAALFRQASAGP